MPSVKLETLRASGALAVATTEYGTGYETQRTSGVATATTSDKLTASAGDFVTNGVAIGDIVKNTTDGTYALVTAVDSATALSLSADIFEDTEEYEIYTNKGLEFDQVFSELVAVLDVTAAQTEAGDLLDVYIDTSFDNGATFVNIGRFTQVTGDGGAKRYIMSFKSNPITASNSIDATADQAESAALQIGFGDRIRYRATVTDATTTGNVSFTFSLKLHLK